MSIWSLGKQKLLIIDDFADMRAMMRTIVASLGGTDIQTAKNGDEAVSLMEFNRFNIILCDYNLGDGKDGQQVLEEARYRELLPYTTMFIMITAENSSMMVLGALEHAPDEYISKPVTRTTLLTRLRNLMQKKENLHPVLVAMDRRCWPAALKQCETLLEADAKNQHDLQQLKGLLLLELGEYDLAESFYSELIKERSLSWILLGLGKALVYSHQYIKAQEVLQNLISTQPNLVTAYDLLSEAMLQQGEWEQAKEILTQGIAVSPKTALRHRRLGQLLYQQGDYEDAESAFRSTLRLSKGSCLRSFGEYTNLIRTLIMKNDPVTAIKTVRDMLREYKQDPSAQAQGAMLEWVAQCKIGNAEAGKTALDEAFEKFKNQPELIGSDVAVFVAELCFQQKQPEFAKQLLRHAVRNQPENAKMHEQILEIFTQAGMAGEGRQLVASAAADLDDIDHQASQLAQLGQYEEAIALFDRTAQALPENTALNLGAANRIILFMQKHGKTPEHMQKARFYLDRVRHFADTDARYRHIKAQLNQLASST